MPNMAYQLLNLPPSVSRAEPCSVNTFRCYLAAQLTNHKMIWWQFRFIVWICSKRSWAHQTFNSHKHVCSSSPSTSALSKTAEIARLADLIILSKNPPKCGDVGGCQHQVTPRFAVIRSTTSGFERFFVRRFVHIIKRVTSTSIFFYSELLGSVTHLQGMMFTKM